MNTRSRPTSSRQEERSTFDFETNDFDLDTLSDEELEALLFDEEPETPSGLWNLPTLAGLSLVVVGMAYLFQQLGFWTGADLTTLAAMLPWIAGILIILLGFGVLSWRPKKKKRKKKAVDLSSGKKKVVEEKKVVRKKDAHRLTRSKQDRKIFGVCGGIAERLSVDPTLVRIAFVVGTIASGGWPFIVAYLALAYVMPEPEELTSEERVTIVRDS